MGRSDDDDEVLLALTRTITGVSTAAADQLGGISVVQLRALTVLRALGTATLGELAQGMAVTLSTTSRLVDRLVAAGLVVREPAPGNRRALALRIASDGQAVLERYDHERLEPLRATLGRIPEADRAAVLSAFAAFTDAARPADSAVAS